MWELDNKKGWPLKTDALELWCWRILLRVPWTARRSNQSILKEINLEYSLEGLMLKLKLQYFGHMMWSSDLIGKDPDAGKEFRQKEKEMQRMRWLDGIMASMDMSWRTPGDGEGQESLVCCSPWRCKESDMTEQLNDNNIFFFFFGNNPLQYTCWRIPWTDESGGLQSMQSWRVGHG